MALWYQKMPTRQGNDMSSNMKSIENYIVEAVKQATSQKTAPYDSEADVIRIDGDTAWVHFAGGVEETPARLTINAKKGDKVQVRVSNDGAYIIGNATAPPTDDGEAIIARIKAITAQETADDAYIRSRDAGLLAGSAYDLASSAKASADGKNTIYRQASQPTGGTYVAGDVWFDTAHDNRIYRYNGSAWAAVTLGDDALAAISANKITAGTIDASVITVSNIDAGNITTGTIDADILMATDLTAYDLSAWSATIGGFYIGQDSLYSPPSAFNWDCTTTTAERTKLNTLLGLSESTSEWAYNDLTSSEMSTLNSLLGLSESTSSWDYAVTVAEYKTLCNSLDMPYQFGRSVYLGNDAISLGEGFMVDEDGFMNASAGMIGGLNIVDGGLSAGIAGTNDYLSLDSATGLKLGQYFSVGLDGIVRMRRGVFGGFTIQPMEGGNDYLYSDYSTGGLDYRTWIRSADDVDGGDTWIYSAQVKKPSESAYWGAYYVTARGELHVNPYDSSGNAGSAHLRAKKDMISLHSSVIGANLKVDGSGIYAYLGNGTTTANQPNLYLDTGTYYIKLSTWTSSSEKIKKRVNEITDERLNPENLYDVGIIQFQYKDNVIDSSDIRYGKDLIGFLIEDMDEKYPIAVDKADPKDPKTWNWNSAYMIPAMLKLIQDQHRDIEELKRKLS